MTKYWGLLLQILIGALAFYLGFKQLPKIWANYQLQGSRVENWQTTDGKGRKLNIDFNGRKVVMFWATWCGPCEIEIQRLKSAVEEHHFGADQIILISLDEEPNKVTEFAKSHGYPFELRFDQDGRLAESLKVRATPTVAFVDEQKIIQWITTGLSPSLIWRAERFLRQ